VGGHHLVCFATTVLKFHRAWMIRAHKRGSLPGYLQR
jgi:hypothetical protein